MPERCDEILEVNLQSPRVKRQANKCTPRIAGGHPSIPPLELRGAPSRPAPSQPRFPFLLEQLRDAHERQLYFMQAEIDRLSDKLRKYEGNEGNETVRSEGGKGSAIDSESASKAGRNKIKLANCSPREMASIDSAGPPTSRSMSPMPMERDESRQPPQRGLEVRGDVEPQAESDNLLEGVNAMVEGLKNEFFQAEEKLVHALEGAAVDENADAPWKDVVADPSGILQDSDTTRDGAGAKAKRPKGRLHGIADGIASHLGRDKSGNSFLKRSTSHHSNDGSSITCTLIANSFHFEIFFALLIVFMALVMAAEAEYTGKNLNLENAGRNQEDQDGDIGHSVFKVIGHIFGALFFTEWIIKIFGEKRKFLKDLWNYFDSILVILWLCELVFPGYFSNIQLLRMLRLCRLARLIKLVRTITHFDDLYLIITALKGSFRVLLSTIVVFAVFQVTVALSLNNLLRDFYLDDPSYPLEEREVIYTYFGTFGRSMLSVFEIVLGNWVPICRVLTESVSLWFIAFGIMHKLMFGFAMVGVINGVFTQETFKIAAADDMLMMRRKHGAKQLHEEKMRTLFRRADVDGNDYIAIDEFQEVMGDKQLRLWLSSMELDIHDLDKVFHLLDSGLGANDGKISCEELIHGCARLKGFARSIDLAHVQVELSQVQSTLVSIKELLTGQNGARDGRLDELKL